MHMVMPDILISRRFVVLPSRNAVAAVSCLHRESNRPHTLVNCGCSVKGEVVDVFKVLIRDDEHMAWSVRPLMRRDEGAYLIVLPYDVTRPSENMLVLNLGSDQAEGTEIAVRGVVIQGVLPLRVWPDSPEIGAWPDYRATVTGWNVDK